MEWVLGDVWVKLVMYVVIELDLVIGVLFVCNVYYMDFGGWVGFFDVDGGMCSVIGDCCEFLGCNGNLCVLVVMG